MRGKIAPHFDVEKGNHGPNDPAVFHKFSNRILSFLTCHATKTLLSYSDSSPPKHKILRNQVLIIFTSQQVRPTAQWVPQTTIVERLGRNCVPDTRNKTLDIVYFRKHFKNYQFRSDVNCS